MRPKQRPPEPSLARSAALQEGAAQTPAGSAAGPKIKSYAASAARDTLEARTRIARSRKEEA
jgi:hypothetical protein